MYASKRRQRNFKRVRNVPNGELSAAKCAPTEDIGGHFAEFVQGHGRQQQSSGILLPSNPSKRHRERLNGELETVASLLPFEEPILQRLDKLSVLRLAVAFLQIKAHFQVCAQQACLSARGCCVEHPLARLNGSPPVGPIPTMVNPQNGMASLDYGEMQFAKLAQKALGAFLLMFHLDGDIFFVTENIENFLGFQQSDLLHQSLFEMIHSEDRDELRTLLQKAMALIPGKRAPRQCAEIREANSSDQNSSVDLSFSVVLRFRCLLDHSCGFNRAELRCRLISLHSHRVEVSPFMPRSQQCRGGQRNCAEFGTGTSAAVTNIRKYALVSTCTPFVPPPQMDPHLDEPILKTKHSLDLGFQSLDLRFRHILELDESLCSTSGASSPDLSKQTLYSFVHPDDLKSVVEAHASAIKYCSSNLMVYRLISSNSLSVNFVQSSFKVFPKNGRPDRIEANHRMLTETDGESLLEKRNSTKFKHFSFDDTLLQSPRICQLPNQQQIVATPRPPPLIQQQSDLLGTVGTETATASFCPSAHANANLREATIAKNKKGKKTSRREAANEMQIMENDRRGGTEAASSSGATNAASIPMELAAFCPSSVADSSAVRLASSQFCQQQPNLNSVPLSGSLLPSPPSADAVMVNNCQMPSSLPWPNAVGTMPSHATQRLKRTQFTFERYYAETVDVSPYNSCYYYCPSSSASGGFAPNSAPVVDFSPSNGGIYPSAAAPTGIDYWNSMLAMAAGPTGGGATTNPYEEILQQQLGLNASSLMSTDPSAHLTLQFQQQFSPAWLNAAAGSVFSFAAAANQFWQCPQLPVDFGCHSSASYSNDQIAQVSATEQALTEMGFMESVDQQLQQHQQQFNGDSSWAIDKRYERTRNDRQCEDGQSERGPKRSNGSAVSVATTEAIGAKNAAPPPPIPAQTTSSEYPTNTTTISNASGFRFLTEMAQTLFG